MICSKVRIEFTEEVGDGIFNTYANESGTVGDIRLGVDLGDVIRIAPRPLAVLARAIEYLYQEQRDTRHPLVLAAREYVERWERYDAAADAGADPFSEPWPDGEGDRP